MNGGMMFEQREVVLIPFPYTDLTGMKQRPALIISNNKINSSDDRICCLITSNKPIDGLEIKNTFFENEKLPFLSWAKPHRIFTINKKIIRKKLCRLTPDFHDKIITTLNSYLEHEKE